MIVLVLLLLLFRAIFQCACLIVFLETQKRLLRLMNHPFFLVCCCCFRYFLYSCFLGRVFFYISLCIKKLSIYIYIYVYVYVYVYVCVSFFLSMLLHVLCSITF